MEIGLYTFAETRLDPETGEQLDARERLAHLLEEIELAGEPSLLHSNLVGGIKRLPIRYRLRAA